MRRLIKFVWLIAIFSFLSISAYSQCLYYEYVDDTCEFVLPDYRDSITVTDNCCLDEVTQSPLPGLIASSGDSVTVTLTARDCHNNVSQFEIVVFIIDTIPPVFSCGVIDLPDPPITLKRRVIILADPNVDPNKETDDAMSLIRLMTYANEIDIEGLVATCSHNLHYRYIEPILERIDAYEEVLPNLSVHANDWPSADYLRSVTALGPAGYGTTFALNEEPISDGAQIIINAIHKDDPRPIWVSVWGDGAVIVQALEYIKQTEGEVAALEASLKLNVLDIAGQDDSGAWLKAEEHYPDMFYVRWEALFLAMDSISDELSWYDDICFNNCSKGDVYFTSDPWVHNNIQPKGPLGALYPDRRYIKEGDTPSTLYYIPTGLNDPCVPSMGGWGGRMTHEPQLNVRSWRSPLTRSDEIEESTWDNYYMYTEAPDTWTNSDGLTTSTTFTSLFRWWEPFQNDFLARMNWSVTPNYDDGNHVPFVVIQGDRSKEVIYQDVNAGDILNLSALGSSDPDGDNISYKWWYYREAGSFNANVPILNDTYQDAIVQVPTGYSGEIHIILEVTDNGVPNLTRYRRIVLNV